jgi:putative ABC transport system permease protein
VVKNYHSRSLKEDFEPLIFLTGPGPLSFFSVKLNTENYAQTLALIKEAYTSHYPDHPFDYFFLEEYFNTQYQADEKLSAMISLFAGLAIFIGSMGLFGLSVYMIADRTKEIGIRKVLGASAFGIVRLVSKHYIQLILIACLVATPLSYWIIKKQIANYSFVMEISVWLFLVPIATIFGIVLLTISAQTIKAALANPVNSLRTE